MKKLIALLMVVTLLFGAVACTTTGKTTDDTTTGGSTETTTDDGTQTTVTTDETNSNTTDETTTDETTTETDKPENTVLQLRGDVKATVNNTEWVVDPDINYKRYSYLGIGLGIEEYVAGDSRFNSLTVSYKLKDEKTGEYKDSSLASVRNLPSVGVYFKDSNPQAKTINAYVDEIEVKILVEYTRVDAHYGSLILLRFTSNVPTTFVAAIGDRKAAPSPKAGTYCEGVTPEGEMGEYVGRITLTVPRGTRALSFINFYVDNAIAKFPFIDSIPLYTTAGEHTSEYELNLIGEWAMIEQDRYLYDLHELFYNVYPRLYARWGTGTEPKTITFEADKDYDGVAYAQGTRVCVSVAYANKNPYDLGFFSHEITHSVQQYGKVGFVYGEGVNDGYNATYGSHNAWWTENMANYGGFRYFHWGDGRWVQVYQPTDKGLQDWGYHPYGNNKWFFAYMDWKYPSSLDENGNRVYGLIDSINFGIKNRQLDTDRPKVAETKFNKLVKQVTGLDTIDDVRLQFVAELKAGTYDFIGFGDYPCNFITEDLPGLENPIYPMESEKTHGDKTAGALPTAVTGNTGNLVIGGSIYDFSGQTKDEERAEFLIDGNTKTKWCATDKDVFNKLYQLQGVPQFVIIDLGEEKDFNTYTITAAGISESASFNIKEWEICVSDDAREWTSVDYQSANTKDTVSFNVGDQSGRYILIKIFAPTQSTNTTVRLYEFGLYNID